MQDLTRGPVARHLLQLSLSRQPAFDIRHVWYLSLASVFVQGTLNLWLLRREFARRLGFAEAPPAVAV